MIGKIIAAAAGASANKQQRGSPVTGAIVGFATMALARRFLPARVAMLGATLAAGYLTKKLADRAERALDDKVARELAEPAGVADQFALIHDTPAKKPRARSTPRADATVADTTMPG